MSAVINPWRTAMAPPERKLGAAPAELRNVREGAFMSAVHLAVLNCRVVLAVGMFVLVGLIAGVVPVAQAQERQPESSEAQSERTPLLPRQESSRGGLDSIEVVELSQADQPVAIVRYQVDWVEFEERIPVSRPYDITTRNDLDALTLELEPNVHRQVLGRAMIPKAQASALLQQCHPVLRLPDESRLVSNAQSTVRWLSREGRLILRRRGIIDLRSNMCIQAVLDLGTGDLVCSPSACVAK